MYEKAGIEKLHYANYSEAITPDGKAILKDGHVMLTQDIVKDLNRRSYLEKRLIALEYLLKNANIRNVR